MRYVKFDFFEFDYAGATLIPSMYCGFGFRVDRLERRRPFEFSRVNDFDGDGYVTTG